MDAFMVRREILKAMEFVRWLGMAVIYDEPLMKLGGLVSKAP
jgi:hypothetical protein